jgi:Tfp pilus assembly protein PilN
VIRINLLPPEILEKRQEEQNWRWVVLGGLVLLVLLVMLYLIAFVQVTAKEANVAEVEQQAANIQAAAAQVEIFKQQEDDLLVRQGIVDKALIGRVDWAKLLYEVSLILPSDMYLSRLQGTEDDPLTQTAAGTTTGEDLNESVVTLTGQALDSPTDAPDLGYKSVAKLLVRMAELEQLQRVWLDSAEKVSGDLGMTGNASPKILFIARAKTPETKSKTQQIPTTAAAGAPAPPAP